LKKQSGANSTSKPPDPPVFFLDACLGKHRIATELQAAGETVIVHDNHFPSGTKDEVWLQEVGKQGWIVLTKDDNIRYHRTERESVIKAGVAVFIMPRGNLKGDAMAGILVKALPTIKKFLSNQAKPFIARLTGSGTISPVDLKKHP
jgi:predicted nuclease of predicted toxin-antitoxin system